MACARLTPSNTKTVRSQKHLRMQCGCASLEPRMSGNLKTLRCSSRRPLRDALLPRFRELLQVYLAKHAHHMTPQRYAACHAAATQVALHGPPPNRQARLAYRRWKKWRARKQMIEEYGDPAAPNPRGLKFEKQGTAFRKKLTAWPEKKWEGLSRKVSPFCFHLLRPRISRNSFSTS